MVKDSRRAVIESVGSERLTNGKTIYKIKTDTFEFATFQPSIAEEARSYQGSVVDINYTLIKKGQYDNYWIDSVSPVMLNSGSSHWESETKPVPSSPANKDTQIARAVALKAAIEYIQIPEQERESLDVVLDLVDEFTFKLLA